MTKPESFKIQVGNGLYISVERNFAPHDREVFVGIVDENDAWLHNIAMIRQGFEFDQNNDVKWLDKIFNVWVKGSDTCPEDYTDFFGIDLSATI